jgi:hypothetical protein
LTSAQSRGLLTDEGVRTTTNGEMCRSLLEAFVELILVIIGAGAVSYWGWRLSLRRHPYAPCRACGGSARNPGSNKHRWGKCSRCGGTGRRLRWGARE